MNTFVKKISNILYYLIILFISYIFANKLQDISSFQLNILKSGIFKYPFNKFISYFVIVLESIVIILLVFKKKIGLKFFLIMISLFTLYILLLFFSNHYEICGCGGVLNGLDFKYHFSINICLICITLIILHYEK